MSLDDCDRSCSGMSLVGCRTISHKECDMELARRDFGYAFVLAKEKVRNYFYEAMKVYGSEYRIVLR
jgi:hypothetical protein